jgi:uncharacterized protein YbaA (DUF1428 family)
MTYIDGFVLPVRTARKDDYVAMSRKIWPMFREFGAQQIVECWGDDVPKGKLTDFHMAVKATEDETVVLSWIVWPSKQVRDAANEKMRSDPRMKMDEDMPFDPKRMIFGGFMPLLDVE